MTDWHKRFIEQLKWTADLRNYLYKKTDLQFKKKVLEIGCGTGALLKELGTLFNFELFGIDIDQERLKIADKELKNNRIKANLSLMDILDNDFQDESFDAIITNCVFLWIKDLKRCFNEIYRILRKKGILLIFAEPDYGGLIEHPDHNLKKALHTNLIGEGADPEAGRKLNQFFVDKFKIEELFCTSLPWIATKNSDGLLKELEFFNSILNKNDFDAVSMKNNIESGNYFIFVPVFSYYLTKI